MQPPKLSAAPSSDHSRFTILAASATMLAFAGFGGFAHRAPLDSAAIASGRVAADSGTKPLQHLEGGIVREILVKESMVVREGQVLFRLEPSLARANTEMVRQQLDAALAQEVRLVAERDGVTTVVFPDDLVARQGTQATVIADQQRQFAERRASLNNQTRILRTRLEQTAKELGGMLRQEVSLKQQIANLTADLESLTPLQQKGLYSRSKLMALQRELSALEGQLGSRQGEIARLGEVNEETKLQISQIEQRFREDAAQLLTEVRARIADAREKLGVARDVMDRIEIRAPQDGIIQALKVHSSGAVIRPGDTLADLVPTGDKLVMAVKVSPLDIDSVKEGQVAEVRFSGFASRGLPSILGNVTRVGADAMLDDLTKEPYYLARVEVDNATLPEKVSQRLRPGMPADIVITTGERTLLQYLIGPLSDLIAKSMREQ